MSITSCLMRSVLSALSTLIDHWNTVQVMMLLYKSLLTGPRRQVNQGEDQGLDLGAAQGLEREKKPHLVP